MEVYRPAAEALYLRNSMNDGYIMLNRPVMYIILLCEAWEMMIFWFLTIWGVFLVKLQNDGIILNEPTIFVHTSFGLNNHVHAEWSSLI